MARENGVHIMKEVNKITEEDISVALSCHSQSIRSLQHQINEIKELTKELRVMNTALTALTTELKHTSETIEDHTERIAVLENTPSRRWEKATNAVITALSSGIVGFILAQLLEL